MGKQKIVIRLTMEDARRRSKALEIAAGSQPGVISAQLEEEKVVVVGEGVDPVALTVKLKKKMGFAELVGVSAVEEKKEEKKDTGVQQLVWTPYQYPYMAAAPPYVYEARDHYNSDDNCNVM